MSRYIFKFFWSSKFKISKAQILATIVPELQMAALNNENKQFVLVWASQTTKGSSALMNYSAELNSVEQ
jgi:hypothetical protein